MFLVSLHPCVAIRHATSPPLRIYITGRWNRDIETGNETLRAERATRRGEGDSVAGDVCGAVRKYFNLRSISYLMIDEVFFLFVDR